MSYNIKPIIIYFAHPKIREQQKYKSMNRFYLFINRANLMPDSKSAQKTGL